MALQIGEEIRDSIPLLLSVPDGEPTKQVWTDILLSVEHLELIPPPHRPDGLCSIYGHFRVSDEDKCASPVTLFNRDRNNPATIDLADPRSRFLPLSDDDETARPVIGGSVFYVQMKLWEKTGDDTHPLIVDVDIKYDDFFKTNKRTIHKFKGDSGFKIRMSYAHIRGPGRSSRVLNEGQLQLTGKRKPPMRVYGSIGATQGMNEDLRAVR